MTSSKLRIVLVRPRDPNNIGAAARAMKNFGLRDLWVAGTHPPVWAEIVSAVNAQDVLAGARVVDTLEEAVADRNLVVGTADHTRVAEGRAVFTPVDLSRDLAEAEYDLALVFGTEKHGLTNEDLSRCHRVMSIPTESDCPSMNLGQAVAVCCYELTRDSARRRIVPRPAEAASAGATESAIQLAGDVLRQIDFFLPGNAPALTQRIRGSLLRLGPTRHDIEMLCGILSRIKRGLGNRQPKTDDEIQI
ncbi:MAG: RNA methyltransferase [Blastocatellia bacterium]